MTLQQQYLSNNKCIFKNIFLIVFFLHICVHLLFNFLTYLAPILVSGTPIVYPDTERLCYIQTPRKSPSNPFASEKKTPLSPLRICDARKLLLSIVSNAAFQTLPFVNCTSGHVRNQRFQESIANKRIRTCPTRYDPNRQ